MLWYCVFFCAVYLMSLNPLLLKSIAYVESFVLYDDLTIWCSQYDNMMIIYEDIMMMTQCQDHILTENIWFVWSNTSYSGDEWRSHECGRTNDEQGKIALLSLWMLEGWVSQQLSTGMHWVHSDISISSNASAKYSQGSGALVLSVDDNFSAPRWEIFAPNFSLLSQQFCIWAGNHQRQRKEKICLLLKDFNNGF